MNKNKRLRLLVLILLLVIVLGVFYLTKKNSLATGPGENYIGSQRKNVSRVPKNLHEAYVESDFDFVRFSGMVSIENNINYANRNARGATGLDGMDREQIADFRLTQVDRYRQLGFFHGKYDPFEYYHQRIYKSITPGERWLGPTPYYISNPYLLIILTCANHVTPLNLYCPDVNITYNNGVIEEVREGRSARCWFYMVYRSDDHPGKVWPIMVNAWDAGFFYIFVDLNHCRNVMETSSPSHITNRMHSRKYFYHVGKYRKNNISPTVKDAWLTLQERDTETTIYVKLWRYPPDSVEDDPDLVYIFRIMP